MVRWSNHRVELIERLSDLIPVAQAETQALDEAAANRLGINRTDLRCLGIVLQRKSVSASALAEAVGLTRGAMTTVLDRLEAARFIRRGAHPVDRRGVQVEATPGATKAIEEIWGPVRSQGLAMLAQYRDLDLRLLIRFFDAYVALQRTHARRIRLSQERRQPRGKGLRTSRG